MLTHLLLSLIFLHSCYIIICSILTWLTHSCWLSTQVSIGSLVAAHHLLNSPFSLSCSLSRFWYWAIAYNSLMPSPLSMVSMTEKETDKPQVSVTQSWSRDKFGFRTFLPVLSGIFITKRERKQWLVRPSVKASQMCLRLLRLHKTFPICVCAMFYLLCHKDAGCAHNGIDSPAVMRA